MFESVCILPRVCVLHCKPQYQIIQLNGYVLIHYGLQYAYFPRRSNHCSLELVVPVKCLEALR